MIYLDHNATTPILPEVLEAMMPYLTTEWGKPSSAYKFGAKLKSVIETAREQVAELMGAHPMDVIFTSCATESNNAAIAAALRATGVPPVQGPSQTRAGRPCHEKRHIVTSQVEHSSVLNYCMALEKQSQGSPQSSQKSQRRAPQSVSVFSVPSVVNGSSEGYRVTYLPVDREGLLNLADLEAAITDETAVVSLMWANNETGVLFPVEKIVEICRSRGVLYHCDAVQAAGKVEIDVRKIPADYLSLTGHKFNAPKGIGALYVRRKAPFSPLIYGGHQERNRRGGTENVPLIVDMGKATELARKHLPDYEKKVRPLRTELEEGILRLIPKTELNGHKTQRLANTTNITFHGVESEALLILLDKEGICASSGSACLADSDEPSHVIKAMKPDTAVSRQMIRFSLVAATPREGIEVVVNAVKCQAAALRDVLSPH